MRISLHMKQMAYAMRISHYFSLIENIFTDHGNIE